MKKFWLLAVLFIVMCLNSGCVRYNAVIYDKANCFASEEFLLDNATAGSDIDAKDGILNNCKESHSYIFTEEEAFYNNFPTFSDDVDFESEMILVYVYTCNTFGCDGKISDIKQVENKLEIKVRIVEPSSCIGCAGSYTAELQRVMIIKTDKLLIDSFEVETKFY